MKYVCASRYDLSTLETCALPNCVQVFDETVDPSGGKLLNLHLLMAKIVVRTVSP